MWLARLLIAWFPRRFPNLSCSGLFFFAFFMTNTGSFKRQQHSSKRQRGSMSPALRFLLNSLWQKSPPKGPLREPLLSNNPCQNSWRLPKNPGIKGFCWNLGYMWTNTDNQKVNQLWLSEEKGPLTDCHCRPAVKRSSTSSPNLATSRIVSLGDAKVSELHLAGTVMEDVLGLDVSVQHLLPQRVCRVWHQ